MDCFLLWIIICNICTYVWHYMAEIILWQIYFKQNFPSFLPTKLLRTSVYFLSQLFCKNHFWKEATFPSFSKFLKTKIQNKVALMVHEKTKNKQKENKKNKLKNIKTNILDLSIFINTHKRGKKKEKSNIKSLRQSLSGDFYPITNKLHRVSRQFDRWYQNV